MSKLEITVGLEPPEFHKEDFVDCSIDLCSETEEFDPSKQYGSWCKINVPNSSDQIIYMFAVMFNMIPTEFMPRVRIIIKQEGPTDSISTIGWKYTPENKDV